MPLKKVWTGGAVTERLVAFADESVRVTANPPIYLIAATIIPENADLSLRWRQYCRTERQSSTGATSVVVHSQSPAQEGFHQ